ncbi:MAG: hypothetical protein IIZ39_07060 [Blautia sp.]|nr:hypothetical protein [Blautia sp.]
MVYVPCYLENFGRNLHILKGQYKLERICLVDMFPATKHVETVVLMSRKS